MAKRNLPWGKYRGKFMSFAIFLWLFMAFLWLFMAFYGFLWLFMALLALFE
jgi:hypothetical protein